MSATRSKEAPMRAYGTGTLYERDGTWYARWRTVDGRRAHRRVGLARTEGRREGLSRKEAEAALRDLMAAEGPRVTDQAPTVTAMGIALESRLASLGRKKSHLESVESHLRVHINPFFERLTIDQVTDEDVQRFADGLLRDHKPKTVRNIVGTLYSLFDLAMRRKVIQANPCRYVELAKAQASHELRFLAPAELAAVLEAAPPADGDRDELAWWPVLRLLVLLAAMTGMRLGELLALTWADLDYGASKIRVRRAYVRGEIGTPKSRRSSRGVPLASRVLSELEEHHKRTVFNQDHDHVLAHPYTGRPVDKSKALKLFKKACVRANVRQVRLHDLRHTFATTMAANPDVSLRMLQEWLGHRDLKTTMIYADYMPADSEAELVDRAFRGQSVDTSEQSGSLVGGE